MHIAVDVRCLAEKNLTGVGEYAKQLLTEMTAMGENHVFTFFYNSYTSVKLNFTAPANCKINYCHTRLPNKLLNLSLALFRQPKLNLWLEKKFNLPKIDLFFFPNTAFLACSCPYIITAHDLGYEFFPEFLNFKRRLLSKLLRPKKVLSEAKKVIAISKQTAEDVHNFYQIPKEKIQIIYSGVSPLFKQLEASDPRLSAIKIKFSLPEKFNFFLGTVEPRKNLSALITALTKDSLPLVIAGASGWKNQDLLNKINDTPKITYLGYVSDEEKLCLYNLAETFVYPSHYEGFGFPPLEAMSAGCPVIAGNNSSLSEILGTAPLLVNSYDPAELSLALNLMKNEETRSLYQEKGFEKVKEFFWKQTAKETYTVIMDTPQLSSCALSRHPELDSGSVKVS